MNAYLRGVRVDNDALVNGRLRGRTASEVTAVLTEATAFFKAQGLVKDAAVSAEDALDASCAEAAVKALGPYRPRREAPSGVCVTRAIAPRRVVCRARTSARAERCRGRSAG